MSEHDEQAALVTWARYNLARLPGIELLFAIPNGARTHHQVNRRGQAFSLEGLWLKAEGGEE
jgi:hypothetical protein